MEILHVYKDYYPIVGGIEHHIKALAEHQAQEGHDVTVLVTNPGNERDQERLNGVQVRRARRLATVASTPISPALPRLLWSLRPTITHLHFPYPVGEVSQLLIGRGRPYVVTYHSDVVRQARILRLYEPLLRRFLRGASRILPTSENYVERSPYLRALAEKCTVVPLSVDAARFHHAEPLIKPATVPTLLFVGRHRYYKGVDDLLRALVDLRARLLIGGDGPMRPAWEQLAAELQIDDRVRFLGNVKEEALPGIYASADIFVLPANSRAEAFGKVLLEAMAAGLPCVTTELGTGTSFVVQHGRSGLVVAPGQPAALTEAIGRLLADAERRREFGATGRARVLKEFTTDTMAARVEAVYKSVLRQS